MQESLTLKDVLLVPAPLSYINSRKDVDTSTKITGNTYKMGIVASNMDSVYSPRLAQETARMGGITCVHRFTNIDNNIKLFKEGIYKDIKPWVSVGLGTNELERAISLYNAGAKVFVVDVANGASIAVIEQTKALIEHFKGNASIIVGNFATKEQIDTFSSYCPSINTYKISVGSGSACLSSIVAGVGTRSFSCIQDCVSTGKDIIFDGGISSPGDYSKTLAAGAKMIMMGKNFAATSESPGKLEYGKEGLVYKNYRGSASAESYEAQGKTASHRAPEGDSFLVKVTGSVEDLMNYYDGGLRSSMTYLNARNLEEFKKNAKFVRITQNGVIESGSHGKTN